MAVKLFLTNPAQTELLCQYIFNLSRYDPNYDIRDRARFLRQFIFPANGESTILSKNARKIFLAAKPAPMLESKYHGREQYQLGSLSHYLNMRANGYHDIPDFPAEAPDASVRNIEPSPTDTVAADESLRSIGSSAGSGSISNSSAQASKNTKINKTTAPSFYSESEKSSSEYGSSSSSSSEESGSDEREDSVDAKDTTNQVKENVRKLSTPILDNTKNIEEGTSDSDEDSTSDDSSDDDDDSTSTDENDDDEEESNGKTFQKAKTLANQIQTGSQNGKKDVPKKSNLDLLLDLDDISPAGPIMTPSLGGFLTPGFSLLSTQSSADSRYELVGPSFIPFNTNELLSRVSGNGLSIQYRYTRAPHLFSATMVSIELSFSNHLANELENIQINPNGKPTQIKEFAPIAQLQPRGTVQGTIGIDFNDSTQPLSFEIIANSFAKVRVTLKPMLGDLVRSIQMPEEIFREERSKLRGMNEHSTVVILNVQNDKRFLQQQIFECANVASVQSNESSMLLFAGQTLSSKSLVLISVEWSNVQSAANVTKDSGVPPQVQVTVNCEKMVVGSMLLNEIKAALNN